MNPQMFRFTSQPVLEKTSFIIGWTKDAGAVSSRAAEWAAGHNRHSYPLSLSTHIQW